MTKNFCLCLAHQGMADMANDLWDVAGDQVCELFKEEELKDYGFIITGHSLGAGVSCLLNITVLVDQLVGKRKVTCYGFAPPLALVLEAIQNCIAYIHNNDAVSFLLSVSSVHRLPLYLMQ